MGLELKLRVNQAVPDIVAATGSGFYGVRVGYIVRRKSSRLGTVGCWAFGTRKFSKSLASSTNVHAEAISIFSHSEHFFEAI
jgi:hypothetical protein